MHQRPVELYIPRGAFREWSCLIAEQYTEAELRAEFNTSGMNTRHAIFEGILTEYMKDELGYPEDYVLNGRGEFVPPSEDSDDTPRDANGRFQ